MEKVILAHFKTLKDYRNFYFIASFEDFTHSFVIQKEYIGTSLKLCEFIFYNEYLISKAFKYEIFINSKKIGLGCYGFSVNREHGIFKNIGFYQDDTENGYWFLYRDEQIFEISDYVNGLREGINVEYNQGVLYQINYYQNSELQGYEVKFYQNGKIKSTKGLDSQIENFAIYYDINGNPEEEGFEKGSEKRGLWISWDRYGKKGEMYFR